ncbi:MAG TPA: glutaredoxin family protein [Steroidobacteraceae bacterium]|nr:glutaredoxin family protein [Steroidobacteraceae bacterium]
MTLAAHGARFRVYTREACALCDGFIAELSLALADSGAAFEVLDVDADPATRRRFGLKVPLLTCDGHVVCHGRLDRAAVLRLL